MRNATIFLVAILAGIAVLAGGYQIGTSVWTDQAVTRFPRDPVAPAKAGETGPQRVLYWRHPDGRPEWSATPARTADGRDYLPVRDEEEPDFPESIAASPEAARQVSVASGERKVLYYRNPMGLPDTSPVPKKDWMGMDYIAVYEGEDVDDGSTVRISLDRVQRAGVRTEAAEIRRFGKPVRAAGKIVADERTLRVVALKSGGFVQKLFVNASGQTVKAGEPLFRLYSPEILKAQAAYRAAMVSANGRRDAKVDGARQRLLNLDVPKSHIQRIGTKGEMPLTIDWPSPASGTIMERSIIEGEEAAAGRVLFRIADLTRVWIIAEISEQDFAGIHAGAPARVTLRAMPDEVITGEVSFVYPELNAETRTGRLRIELPNPEGRVKLEMYADISIETGDRDRLSIPVDAVIESGKTPVVLVDRGEGRFEPRAILLGVRSDGYVEVREGLSAGEQVVVGANFLIDAESNLKAALKAFTNGQPTSPDRQQPAAAPASAGEGTGEAATGTGKQ
jgi:Cu(I)/Ag(I) efflux system membrane fusion protein